ncbi:MAG: Sec-independent protein translocase subunit TatA/TatB [Eubacteriaceae bacterium]
MLGRIGTTELLIVLGIALIVFGPKQLPKLGKTFGKTIRGFKDGVDGDEKKSDNDQE